MKVLVDARPLITVGNGNARYLSGMLESAIKLQPNWHWHLISHRALHTSYASIFTQPNVEISIHGSFMSKAGPLWLHSPFSGSVIDIIGRVEPDLFWSTLFLLPYHYQNRTTVPTILNVHDLNPFVVPETMKAWVRIYSRQFLKDSIRNANRVLCLSQTTRNHILNLIPDVNPQKLTVQYPGINRPPDTRKRPLALPASIAENRFLLAVGTLESRKNFDTLIQAHIEAGRQNADLLPLVIAGGSGWNMTKRLQQLQKNELVANNIHFVESPKDSELFWLYQNAKALFFASYHEGFGLPVIEALQFNKPVYLSDIEIFREIAPDADFIAPTDVDGWSKWFLYLTKNQGKQRKFNQNEWTYKNRANQLCQEFQTAIG
ncbi:MAG: glycosyltransferase family 4 protein [Leptonema sp. (in: Bacteria)]|nr:glycosyltransferase family 4 protein [Leptonema sp. (in: bacteria)]